MSVEVTELFLTDYFGAHIGTAPSEHYSNASALLSKVNVVLAAFVADGGKLHIDPDTGTLISGAKGGSGDGGYRLATSATGAPNSRHKSGQAVDVYDPNRDLARWVMKNQPLVHQQLGLSIERPEWTPNWVHFQSVPPGSGVFAFIPNSSPALAPALDVA